VGNHPEDLIWAMAKKHILLDDPEDEMESKKIRVIHHTAGRCNMQLGCSIQLKDLIINLIICTLTLSSLPTGQ
jgi:hypothetical protein